MPVSITSPGARNKRRQSASLIVEAWFRLAAQKGVMPGEFGAGTGGEIIFVPI